MHSIDTLQSVQIDPETTNTGNSRLRKPAMQGREHHFVPQFYLRAFSRDGRSINCFNFARQQWIKEASIKHQCSRHNFHSFAPLLETKLAELEGQAASVIRVIREQHVVPAPETPPWHALLTYVIYQKLRTPRATQQVTKMTDYFRELLGEFVPRRDLTDMHPVAVTLSVAGDILPIARDLEMHLICNETQTELITSDDPVVTHNQFCEGIKHTGVLGWNCRGFQAFLPLSPNVLLVLFDTAVYRVGSSHKGVQTTRARHDRDIEAFNLLQIHNADENVYFADIRLNAAAAQSCWRVASSRNKTRVTFIETERVKETETRQSAIVGHFENLLPVPLETSLILVQKKAKRVPLGDRARMQRNPRPSRVTGSPSSGANTRAIKYRVKAVTRR